MELQVMDNRLTAIVDLDVYPEPVLFKCLYWYTNNYEVEITKVSTVQLKCTIAPKEASATTDWDYVISRLRRDLVDFKLRQIVSDETKTIRELLIAKAFAYYDQEDMPASGVTDPVGFDPQSI